MSKNEFMRRIINDQYERRRLENAKRKEADIYATTRGQILYQIALKQKTKK